MSERHRRDWEELAEADALWAVLTAPGRKGGRWDAEEFFATGEAEIAHVLAAAGALGLPAAYGAALDFGCGVGRLTRALAARFERAVGIDIARGMVERARTLNEDVPNVEFVVSADKGLGVLEAGSFDLVYSSIVLQHVPTRAEIERYLADFVRLVPHGGLVVFGLPTRIPFPWSLQPRRRLYALLRRVGVGEQWLLRRTPLTPMRMTAISEPEVRRLLEARGGEVLRTEPVDEGPVSALRYYVRRR